MNFKGLGGRGANQSVQESIARTQLGAVNKSGHAKAEAKKRLRASNDERRELLKNFHTSQVVNNGKETGRIVDSQLDPPVLVVRLASGKRVTWAPDNIEKGPFVKK